MNPGTSKQVRNRKKNKKKKRNPNPNPKAKEENRNWLDLPKDVMIHIFLKLGVIEILHNAQSVCSSWRTLAKEPQLFRCIDMRNLWNYFDEVTAPAEHMALEALDRSCGQLVEFSIDYFGTDEVLQRIVDNSSSNSLRCLRLISCTRVSDDGCIEVVKKLPSLEELELCLCYFTPDVIEAVGRSCPQLKSFRLNHKGVMHSSTKVLEEYNEEEVLEEYNEEALAIAANMPQLRRLHLFGNTMNENGLKAILDKCIHLEYLDLRQCFSINFDEDLRSKCKEIKSLRMPNDSTDDYEFDATIHYRGSFDDDDVGSGYDDYSYDLSDLDLYEDGAYDIFEEYSNGSSCDYSGFE